MMPSFLSKTCTRWIVVLVVLLAFVYAFTGGPLTPNWDEEASLDIALGIRPAMVTDPHGLPTRDLQYEQIIADTAFSAADYERHNTPEGVMRAVMQDNSNSFLYYLALHAWLKMTGVNFLWLRLFTVLAAVINLLLIYRITKAWLPQQPYWAVAALLIVGINSIYFSQAFMIRGYMLCITFLLLSTSVWLKTIHHRSFALGSLLLHSGFCLLAILTHYFSIAIVAGQVIYLLLVCFRQQSPERKKSFPRLLAALILLMAPLVGWFLLSFHSGIPHLKLLDKGWQQASAGTGYAIGIVNYGKQLFNATAFMLGFDYRIGGLPKIAWQGVAAAMMGTILFLLLKAYRIKGAKAFNIFLFLWATAIMVYSLRSWLSGHFMIFERKYLIFLLPYLVMGLICLASDFMHYTGFRRLIAGVGAFWVLLNVVTFAVNARLWQEQGRPVTRQYIHDKGPWKTNIGGSWQELRAMGRELSEKLSAGDTIVYTHWKTAHCLNYFLRQRPDIHQRVSNAADSRESITIKNGQTVRVFYLKRE